MATPDLADPNFFRTVVLLLEHGEEGSLGLVLNRPTRAAVAATLPQWADLTASPARFFRGGPVQPEAVIGLARSAAAGPPDAWAPVLDDVGVIDLRADPQQAPPLLQEVRVFSGYAGWGASQLEAELTAGGWLVTDAQPTDPFTPSPDALWDQAQRRPPRGPAWMANHPLPPSN